MEDPEINFNDPEQLSKVMSDHGVIPKSKRPCWKRAAVFLVKAVLFSALMYGLYKGGELIVSILDKI